MSLEDAYDEHERLARALEVVRAEQRRLLTALVDEIIHGLAEVAPELGFAMGGVRARGLSLPREPSLPQLFVVLDDDAGWAVVERHALSFTSVPKRLPVGALLDAFGRACGLVLRSALQAALAASRAREVPVPLPASPARAPSSRASVATSPLGVRACPACSAQLKPKNFAHHLRAIHGLDPTGRRAKSTAQSDGARHQVCRLCSARLPAGRLDAHMTVMHGIFHVHPAGNHGDGEDVREREERRRESSRMAVRRVQVRPLPRPSKEPSRAAPIGGRDFLAETRHERTLVARADAPERNRDREGRFSDAPDVERMDGDSHA